MMLALCLPLSAIELVGERRAGKRTTPQPIAQIQMFTHGMWTGNQSVERRGATPRPKADQAAPVHMNDGYGKLPLCFELNLGQADDTVKFLARAPGFGLFLTSTEAVLALRREKADPRLAGATNHIVRGAARVRSQKSEANPEPRTPAVLRMRLVGANPAAQVTGLEELPGKINYFIGSDSTKWRTNIPNYAKVQYSQVYPGVDLVYYGSPAKAGQLEYDFVVAPGADPGVIKLGIDSMIGEGRNLPLHIDPDGDLVIPTNGGEIRFHKPIVYQPAADSGLRINKHSIDGRYFLRPRKTSNPESGLRELRVALATESAALNGVTSPETRAPNSEIDVSFQLGAYDSRKPLVIDPVLVYSTELGGLGAESGNAIAVDASGNAYVTGYTSSSDFVTSNPLQLANHGVFDAFVMKINASGTAFVYSTYLGGSGDDQGNAIAVDNFGDAFVAGKTNSTDFPTANAFQATSAGDYDAFVTELNATGSALVYSTYLGGSGDDEAWGIALDSSGNAFVAGKTNSTDFPTANAFQATSAGDYDAFVTELSATGAAIVYSTYLGGTRADYGYGVAVDPFGNAYVTGVTSSTDFPTSTPLQGGNAGRTDAFISEINTAGSALVYSTYLGGGGDDLAVAITVDAAGNAYVTGETTSTDFPTRSPLQAAYAGGTSDAFVTKLGVAGSALMYSTYLGGGDSDIGNGIAVDSSGNAYITGQTASTDFPTANPYQLYAGANDSFITKINAEGTALVYSTYFGGSGSDLGNGIAVDSSSTAYIVGSTTSPDFPMAARLQIGLANGYDAFITKIANTTLSVTPASLDFGSQLLSTTSASQTLTLNTDGTAPVAISNIVASGDFAQTTNCGSNIPGGGTCTISVSFTPTSSGSRVGALTIVDNTFGAPHTIPLAGVGAAPSVTFSPTSLNFGDQMVATTSSPQVVTQTNTGTARLSITSVAVSSDFAQSNTCGANLTPGASCTFSLTFAPTASGAKTGTLSVSDDASGSPQTVTLNGMGLAPSVTASPTKLTFGDQVVGTTSAAQPVTVSNGGNASLTITEIDVSREFAETNACGSLLAAGANCTINLTFTPTTAGSRSGVIRISDNAPGSPHTIALSGTGSDFSLTASPTSVTVTAGQPANYKLTITPAGGFNQSVSLSCSGAPQAATCSASPAAIKPDGTNASNATVTVTTTGRSGDAPRGISPRAPNPGGNRVWHFGPLLLALLMLAGSALAARRPARLAWAATLVFFLLGAACGGGGVKSNPGDSNPVTPTGTYSLTVTASAANGSLTHKTKLTLQVN